MPEHVNSSKETEEGQQEDPVRRFLRRPEINGVAIAIWLFIGGFFLLRLYLYDHIPADPGRTVVLVESMFSLAIVIVIVVHAVMYRKQAEAMKGQLTAMKGQLNEMGAQTKLATKVAEATIIAERAYMGMDVARLTELPIGGHPKGTMILRNGGKTPAFNLEAQYGMSVGPEPGPWGWDATLERHDLPSLFISGQPRVIDMEAPNIPVTAELIKELRAKRLFIFLYGEVHYVDYAGNSHVLSFRGELDPNTEHFKEHYQLSYSGNPD